MAATSGRGEENWDKIIKLCDRIRDSYGATAMASALSSVMKRMKSGDASVQQQAVTVSHYITSIYLLGVCVCVLDVHMVGLLSIWVEYNIH